MQLTHFLNDLPYLVALATQNQMSSHLPPSQINPSFRACLNSTKTPTLLHSLFLINIVMEISSIISSSIAIVSTLWTNNTTNLSLNTIISSKPKRKYQRCQDPKNKQVVVDNDDSSQIGSKKKISIYS